ncbi:MAG: DUF4351 domain-containing protein [Lautropia sp.]|nr:DUF4351 domain-containing protein [Lautropia sp.]
MSRSHDQDFKNLILDYPRQALDFFAHEEAIPPGEKVEITPIRQEMLKDRLGDRFHELDVPLKVEWEDGRREILLFLLEQESDPSRFSIHRLGVYCLKLAELYDTQRVVPVVIFLKASPSLPTHLQLGGDRHKFMSFHYLSCTLGDLPFQQFLASDNIVARICLKYMAGALDDKVALWNSTNTGILQLESDPNKQDKYLDMVNRDLELSDEELQEYARRYPKESEQMAGIFQRKWEEGMQSGLQQGMQQGIEQGLQQGMQQGMRQGVQQGSQSMLARLLRLRFGELSATTQARLEAASQTELDQWAERILTAQTLDEVFRVQ